MRIWAFIPARGGSQSIPMKNLHPLGGRPLIDYCIASIKKAGKIDKIVCSTDEPKIAHHVENLGGVHVVDRPPGLTDGASYRIADVLKNFLSNYLVGDMPDAILLVQPTSPFFQPASANLLHTMLKLDDTLSSVQTITVVRHNDHAWNQRVVGNRMRVEWAYPAEREAGFNKGLKPVRHKFGNLVITRSTALLNGEDVFASPSQGVEVGWSDAWDCDSRWDFMMAELMLKQGIVGYQG